ncbi:hypothetical protein ACETK8_15950 [Brevundimonas staleyi]|uniref:Uncharacterized protein n=1 Tax=Brevundimonas staleyi TaxID=74326 RepID=A0ABW0FX34_9CAUL
MRSLSDLAHMLNAMSHEWYMLTARDIDDLSEDKLTPETLEAALRPLFNRPGFTVDVMEDPYRKPMVRIGRPPALAPRDIDDETPPEPVKIDDRLSRWHAHMDRFIRAHEGQPQGSILIELERRESWAKMMPHLADILDAPEVR